mmetsp:Transcript_54417/g.149911  ORF Transcript_54417/g.149911 Transcript_54417/m.149911 type:complete len:268 (-) Transcript_54417:141-944(-)
MPGPETTRSTEIRLGRKLDLSMSVSITAAANSCRSIAPSQLMSHLRNWRSTFSGVANSVSRSFMYASSSIPSSERGENSAWPPSDGQHVYLPLAHVRKHSPSPVPAPTHAIGAPGSGLASLRRMHSFGLSVRRPYPCASKSLISFTVGMPSSSERRLPSMIQPFLTLVKLTQLLRMPPAHARQHTIGFSPYVEVSASFRNLVHTAENDSLSAFRYFFSKTIDPLGVSPCVAVAPGSTRKRMSRVFVPPQSPDITSAPAAFASANDDA